MNRKVIILLFVMLSIASAFYPSSPQTTNTSEEIVPDIIINCNVDCGGDATGDEVVSCDFTIINPTSDGLLNATLCDDVIPRYKEYMGDSNTRLNLNTNHHWTAKANYSYDDSYKYKEVGGNVDCHESSPKHIYPEVNCYLGTTTCIDINAKKDTETGADISADYNLVVTGSDTETEIAGKTHNIEKLELFPNMCSSESTSDLCINISGSMWATGYEDLTIGNIEIPCELYPGPGLPGECLVSLAPTCNTTHIIYKFTANRDITENDVTINTSDCPSATVTNIDPGPEIDYTKMVTIPLSSLDGCTFTVGVNDCLCTDTTFSPETDAEILENCTDNTFTAEIINLSCNHVKVCVKDDKTGGPVKDVDVTLHGTSYINMSIATGFTIAGITNETGCIEMPLSLGENITHVSVEGLASKEDYSTAIMGRSAECGEEHGCSTGFCNETITCCEGLTCINNTCTKKEEPPEPPEPPPEEPPSGANQTYPNITLGNKTLIIGCMLGDCDEQLKSGDNYNDNFVNWDLKMRSGCAGLFVIKIGNFIFCDILWLILLLLASYDAWRVHERNKRKSKNGLVVTPIEKFGPLITWLIPMIIGYITFVWIGIIVALVMFAYITEKIDKEYENKKNQTSSGKWFHQLNIKTENTQSNIKQPKPKKINKNKKVKK